MQIAKARLKRSKRRQNQLYDEALSLQTLLHRTQVELYREQSRHESLSTRISNASHASSSMAASEEGNSRSFRDNLDISSQANNSIASHSRSSSLSRSSVLSTQFLNFQKRMRGDLVLSKIKNDREPGEKRKNSFPKSNRLSGEDAIEEPNAEGDIASFTDEIYPPWTRDRVTDEETVLSMGEKRKRSKRKSSISNAEQLKSGIERSMKSLGLKEVELENVLHEHPPEQSLRNILANKEMVLPLHAPQENVDGAEESSIMRRRLSIPRLNLHAAKPFMDF
jgi:hypothetical protein